MLVGRFAPSPTGPLHLGSLVAAVGSWLYARANGGKWLVRMEDLDTPRVVPEADREILESLRRYGLEWDGEVVYQSQRLHLYEETLDSLRSKRLVFDCGCSRADLQRAASAPAAGDPAERIYPGTCRHGLPPGRRARAVRFRAPDRFVTFDDFILGTIEENVAERTGDFVVKRADGVFAYQLAVVVDDEKQGVTQVVRGADLLPSTARQVVLQEALGYRRPAYGHLPLVFAPDGTKLGKRDGALPLPSLDQRRVCETLRAALAHIGIESEGDSPERMLEAAISQSGLIHEK
jgi:glutamyl-Q tRNA(Asp) synthetase